MNTNEMTLADLSFDPFGISDTRTFLRGYVGREIDVMEEEALLKSISEHKWYMSEKFDRDIGFRAAATDYVDNYYRGRSDAGLGMRKITQLGKRIVISYLSAKGNSMPL